MKTPEWRQWCRSGVFITNFEHISHCLVWAGKCQLGTLSFVMPRGVSKTQSNIYDEGFVKIING